MAGDNKEKEPQPIFEEFLRLYCHEKILDLAREYPIKKTLVIDFADLETWNPDIAQTFLDAPKKQLEDIERDLRAYTVPADVELKEAKVAIRHLPDAERIPIHDIGAEHLSHLIAIEGRITKSAPANTRIEEGAFKCRRCGKITMMPQPDDDRFLEPWECEWEDCGRKGPFRIDIPKSIKVDEQRVEIQDLYENVKPSHPIRSIIAKIRGRELINEVPAIGAQVIVTGIVQTSQQKGGKEKKNHFDPSLEVIHIDTVNPDIDTTLTDADKKEIRALAEKDNIFDLLANSTAPHILGYKEVKLALLAATVSGPNEKLASGGVRRWYVHVAIVGDPGTGKTQMVDEVRSKVARSQYAAGKQVSAAGLTVAAIKDDLSGHGYTAQAGALVLADWGLMVIDEIDKFEKDDVQLLNTVMEKGSFEYHKGGINQTFNARCPIFAVGNPKGIRFNNDSTIPEQVDMPIDTLSRFDLVIKIMDIPDPERDRKIAEHIDRQIDNTGDDSEDSRIPISHEMMCKYLAYAKTMNPKLPNHVKQRTTDYYLELRRNSKDTMLATARDKNGLNRITKAIAKLRLATECSIEDAELAIAIHRRSMDTIIDPITGRMDGDILFGGSKSQKMRMAIITDAIRGLSGNVNTATYDEILAIAKAQNITPEETSKILQRLKSNGDAIEVSDQHYIIVS
jgi:replicative DNA helicase Mcm